MFSNARRVLSQCNTRLRLLYLFISLNRVFIAIHKKARFVVNFSLIMAGSASEALYNASLFTLHSLAKRYSRNKDNNNGAQQFLGNAGQVLPSDY